MGGALPRLRSRTSCHRYCIAASTSSFSINGGRLDNGGSGGRGGVGDVAEELCGHVIGL